MKLNILPPDVALKQWTSYFDPTLLIWQKWKCGAILYLAPIILCPQTISNNCKHFVSQRDA